MTLKQQFIRSIAETIGPVRAVTDNSTTEAQVKDFPTDPMRQNDRLVAAFCDDLWDQCLNGKTGTPRADRVAEISRQINEPQLRKEREGN